MLANLIQQLVAIAGRPVAYLDPELRAPLAIGLGAIPGALARYYLTLLFDRWFGSSFPFGTFFINVTGSFVMGLFITWMLLKFSVSPELRLFFAVGFLGSYTTFSTYALDTALLMRSQSSSLALFYWLGSAVFGVVGIELGSVVAHKLFG